MRIVPWQKPGLLWLVLTGLMVILAYSPALNAYFVGDDFTHLYALAGANGGVRWGLALKHWVSGQHFASWRPMVTLYEIILYQLFGAHPLPLHIANLLLDLGNAVLMFMLVRALKGGMVAASMALMLFAVQPLHPEAVSWFAANPGLLTTAFGLGTMIVFVRWHENRNWRTLLASMALLALAFASKEEAVGLPFAIGWLALMLQDKPWSPAAWIRAAIEALPAFLVLALYFSYRHIILGSFVPIYSVLHIDDFLSHYVLALGKLLKAFFMPLNQEVLGIYAPTLNDAYAAVMAVAMLYGLFAGRAAWRSALAFAGLFLAFLIPTHIVLVQGIDPGLTGSRFAYLPSLALAGMLGCLLGAAAIKYRRFSYALGAMLVLFGTVGLYINNTAWRTAGRIMRTMQQQSMTLTGGDIRAQLVNVPDKVKGVIINRGGWAFARLQPFYPGSSATRLRRSFKVRNLNSEPVRLALSAQSRDMQLDVQQPIILQWGQEQRVTWDFDPSSRGVQSAALSAMVSCPATPKVSEIALATGYGLEGAPSKTWISAFMATQPDLSGTSTQFIMQISDALDGKTAWRVSVDLPKEAPWAVNFSRTDKNVPSGPFDLDDGQSATVLVTLTRKPGITRWPVLAPLVHALNAVAVQRLNRPRDLLIYDKLAKRFPEARRAPAAFARPAITLADTCSHKAATPTPLPVDFGPVALAPANTNAGEPAILLPEKPSGRLFWDSQHSRVVAFAQTAKAAQVYRAQAAQLAAFTQPPGQRSVLAGPDLLALSREKEPMILLSPKIEIDPKEVAYALVEMRAIGVLNPFTVFAWSTVDAPGFVESGWAPAVISADGRWRTYAVALYDNSKWRDHGTIRRLRYTPSLNGGTVEIRSITLIGSLP